MMSWKSSPPECGRRPQGSFGGSARLTGLGIARCPGNHFDLEQRFDIEIPFNANTKLEFDTVGALVQAIERLIAEKTGSK